MQIVIKNRASEQPRLHEALEAFGAEQHIPRPTLAKVGLALEELITNILTHAYPDDREHDITVSLERRGDEMSATLADDGIPFDPTRQPAPDTSLPLSEKPVGGLGIHMARQSVDAMTYTREQGRNILRLVKKF